MSLMIPKNEKINNLQYDDIRGDLLRSPHGTKTSGSEDKISSERRSSGSINENSNLGLIESVNVP